MDDPPVNRGTTQAHTDSQSIHAKKLWQFVDHLVQNLLYFPILSRNVGHTFHRSMSW